jgi:hypothetical protein
MNTTKKTGFRVAVTIAVLGMVLLVGCRSTFQSGSAEPSGFLGDYTKMTPGEDGQAQLLYINRQADFQKYDKIMIDPVKCYVASNGSLTTLDKDTRQDLINYLDATIREHLKTDYTIVEKAGPDVMRLRVALTDAKGSKVVLDTISSIVPFGIAIGAVKKVATGSNLSVGRVSAECEVVDSVSNVRLIAAVDERVGRKYTGKFDKFSRWHTAKDAFDYWALRMQVRLTELRGGSAE